MDISSASKVRVDGLEVDISVSPRSDRSGAEGVDGWRNRLIIRVRSPPLDGKANKEVEAIFKEYTGCTCEITKGHTSRQKTIMIYGRPSEITALLEELF